MILFWSLLLIFVVSILALCWRHDQRMKRQGRSVRSAGDMLGDSRSLKLDVRVAADQAGWSRTAASYTSGQLAERAARRDVDRTP